MPSTPVEDARRKLLGLYGTLEGDHGRLGWWPGRTRIEIIVGAILTQGTAWKNVEQALAALRSAHVLSVPGLARTSEAALAPIIRPSGYYRQKARKIKAFLEHLFTRYGGDLSRMARMPTEPLRRELLGIWGIGPETADSILLYAFGRAVFVVDTYTHRLLRRHGLHPGGGYEEVRIFLEERLEPELYNDFHAQIVWVGNRFCGTKPRCEDCPLGDLLPARRSASRPRAAGRLPKREEGEVRGRLAPFDQALATILGKVPALKRETVALPEALGRVLAGDVRADRDLPPFDRAALDGYAVRIGEPFGKSRELPVVGEIGAGSGGPRSVKVGTCVRIWTGASVPKGAEGIIPVERARESEGRVLLEGPLLRAGKRRPGIADRAEDAAKGEVLIARGATLTEGDLVVLGAVGRSAVPVYREPSISLLVTGHELVRPDQRPAAVQIRSTNDLVVTSLLAPMVAGGVTDLGIVEDESVPLRRAIRRGLTTDLLIVTGGVSMGRFDLVPELLESLGVKVHLHGLAIRPGKPFLFGTSSGRGRRTTVFGLPGNPVSTMVTTHVLVAPFLRAFRGQEPGANHSCQVRLSEPIVRGGRLLHFVPAELGVDGDARITARALPMNGSGDFVSASRANGFLRVPGDGRTRRAGTILTADPLPGTAWLGEKR